MSEIPFDELRTKALSLGWDDIGVTTPIISEEDISAYRQWLSNGHQARLSYMENELRCYPERLFPGAKSAIIFVSNYKQQRATFAEDRGVIASYARGKDYHNIHHSRLKKMIRWLEERVNQQGIAKGFSDSTPILEKALAVKAGLGWFGKNTLLIHRRFGTFTLLSGLLTTLELSYKVTSARLPRCGVCTRCLDACPTQALVSPYHLDANLCLSNHLIESKEPIPEDIQKKNPGYAFGCDICQDVCPHNVRSPLAQAEEFSPAAGMGAYLGEREIANIEEHPEKLFGTPLKRRGAAGLRYTWEMVGAKLKKGHK